MSSANGSSEGAIMVMIPPNIVLLTGPQLLGLFFNWGLLGVLGTQVYIYYLCFSRDSRYTKLLVYGLFILEIAQTCMLSSDAFHWLVIGWGRIEYLENYELTWFDVPILAGIISATVQIFFAWRIWKLGNSMILGGLIVALALTQGSAAIASGIEQTKITSVAQLGTLFPAVTVWLGGSALVDIIIAISMTYLLSKARGGFGSTDYLLTRLIRLTVETGTLTATVATLDVILFNVFKDNNLHMCPAFVLAKLYSNTLMVVFNQRIFIGRAKSANSSSSGHGRVEAGDFYSTRVRASVSQAGSTTLGSVSFGDTFKDVDVVEDVPLDHLSGRNTDGMRGRPEKINDSVV